MNTQDFENQLIEAIKQIKINNDNLEQSLNRNCDIILLLGGTGSGKSTIFNLLCGAQLVIKQENGIDVISVKDGTRHYSIIKHKINSQTLQPIYYYSEQNNQILIDFPGLTENRTKIEDLTIQLLFHKILTKYNVKLIYLVQQPSVFLLNRGIELQSFIKIFQDQQVNFSEFLFVFHQFIDDKYNDDSAIQQIQQQLMSITNNIKHQNIFLIRRLNQQNVEQIPQIKQNLWDLIKGLKSMKISNIQIPKLKMINKYLQKKEKLFVDEITIMLQREKSRLISVFDDITELQNLHTLISFFVNDQSTQFQFQQQFQLYQQLPLLLQFKRNINKQEIKQYDIFFQVFNFFEEFKDDISYYTICLGMLLSLEIEISVFFKLLEEKIKQQALSPSSSDFFSFISEIQQQREYQSERIIQRQELNTSDNQLKQDILRNEAKDLRQQYDIIRAETKNKRVTGLIFITNHLIPYLRSKGNQ